MVCHRRSQFQSLFEVHHRDKSRQQSAIAERVKYSSRSNIVMLLIDQSSHDRCTTGTLGTAAILAHALL
jgi:hypothetical protein